MGWKPQDYKVFSLRDFINAFRGHDKQNQQLWAMARQIGFYSVVANQGKKGKIRKPTDLFELEIDGNRKRKKGLKVSNVRKVGTTRSDI